MMQLKVGARKSALSKVQVKEVMDALRIDYAVDFIDTRGDLDLTACLEAMDKTDFFTREIDEKVVSGVCDIGIHSAKDLPDPLPRGLQLVALTRGIDPRDSLVMRPGQRLETLRKGARIGSSSFRRDAVIRGLRPDLHCVPIRGTINARLDQLDSGKVDGLVVAEAALIRLGMLDRNRLLLPGKTAPLQGCLAVVGRKGDRKVEALFSQLDSRKQTKTLYLGLDPSRCNKKVVHCPLIHTVRRPFTDYHITRSFADIPSYTHLIFTSQNTVLFFFQYLKNSGFSLKDLEGKKVFAIGKVTGALLKKKGVAAPRISQKETQEGMIHLLAMEDLDEAYVFLPQSSQARSSIAQALVLRSVRHQRCVLYDTKTHIPCKMVNLDEFETIIFTSPSTVRAFKKIFGKIPFSKNIQAIGPVTEFALKMAKSSIDHI